MIEILLVIIAGLLCLNARLLWLIASNQKASHNNISYKLDSLIHEVRVLNHEISTIYIDLNVMADRMEKGNKNDGERKNNC